MSKRKVAIAAALVPAAMATGVQSASALQISTTTNYRSGGAVCNGQVSANGGAGVNATVRHNALCTQSLGQPAVKFIWVSLTSPSGQTTTQVAGTTAQPDGWAGGGVSGSLGSTEKGNYQACGFYSNGLGEALAKRCVTGPLK